jgi:hypothetical protein
MRKYPKKGSESKNVCKEEAMDMNSVLHQWSRVT